MTTPFEPAYKTHEDATDDVLFRLQGLQEVCGRGTPGLGELKATCKRKTESGVDPLVDGTVEVGLLLPVDDYESLKAYAKSLPILHPKRRRS